MVSALIENIPLSIPAPGRTIQSLVTLWEAPILNTHRALIAHIKRLNVAPAFVAWYDNIFSPVIPTGGVKETSQITQLNLASAAVITIWMLAKHHLGVSKGLPFTAALEWFIGPSIQSELTDERFEWIDEEIFEHLENLDYGKGFYELFPYILELFQTDNKSSIGDSTKREDHKRREGIFYTPSDLADYMVKEVSVDWKTQETYGLKNSKWLDPACGAGTFFIAILNWARGNDVRDLLLFAIESIYGIDFSPYAIQASAFVLTNYLLSGNYTKGYCPWEVWQLIRGNLAVADATLVAGIGISNHEYNQPRKIERESLRKLLINHRDFRALLSRRDAGLINKTQQKIPYQLGDIFPECEDGVDCLVGNPPYSVKQNDEFFLVRKLLFESYDLSKDGNIYTLFVEMLWKFTRRDSARGGLVLPLSMAYNTHTSFRHLRSLIEKSKFHFRFSFFDRTPDSLFGDAVKTRNSTIIMVKDAYPQTIIETGPLTRWNSRNRKQLFASLSHVKLDNFPIKEFIPKLGTNLEQDVYRALIKRPERLGGMWKELTLDRLETGNDPLHIYYYGIAYNWLSVFRSAPRDRAGNLAISSSLKGLECTTNKDADFVYALMSSRLLYWLWRVEGDGFHLTLSFLGRIPIHISLFGKDSIDHLTLLSKELWENLLKNPIESRNAGKTTINYSPELSAHIIDKIDEIVIRNLDLPENFAQYLKEFVDTNIVVGRYHEPKYCSQRKS